MGGQRTALDTRPDAARVVGIRRPGARAFKPVWHTARNALGPRVSGARLRHRQVRRVPLARAESAYLRRARHGLLPPGFAIDSSGGQGRTIEPLAGRRPASVMADGPSGFLAAWTATAST